jgi:flagellar biosynthesis protein FliQ
MATQRSNAIQLVVSLLIAALIVAVTISVVSAQFPLREVPREQEEHGGGNSGPG